MSLLDSLLASMFSEKIDRSYLAWRTSFHSISAVRKCKADVVCFLTKLWQWPSLVEKDIWVVPQISRSTHVIKYRNSDWGGVLLRLGRHLPSIICLLWVCRGVLMVHRSFNLSNPPILRNNSPLFGLAMSSSSTRISFNVNDNSEMQIFLIVVEFFLRAIMSSSLKRRSKIRRSRE